MDQPLAEGRGIQGMSLPDEALRSQVVIGLVLKSFKALKIFAVDIFNLVFVLFSRGRTMCVSYISVICARGGHKSQVQKK
jgi:hypothetical protein